MKIAIIGAHGTGKSTYSYGLIYYLKKKTLNAGLLKNLMDEYYPNISEESITSEGQLKVISKQEIKERELGKKVDHLVCDGSVIESYIYLASKFGRNLTIEPQVDDLARTYDCVFKFPINPQYFTNSLYMDKRFQQRIDSIIDRYLKDKNIAYHQAPLINPDAFMLKILGPILDKAPKF